MSYTLFISDLHLSPTRQDLVGGFIEFCRSSVAQSAEAIYILGDFVEFWIGDDTPTTGLKTAFQELQRLSQNGVKLYFQHGNRDFLVGKKFSQKYKISLLNDHEVINLYGTPTLLLHGDTLCTDDTDYQNFRTMVRAPEWQQDVLSKSLYGRIQYAQSLRKQTTEAVQEKSADIMDVNQQAVLEMFNKFNVKHMIHGHTHRPAQHELSMNKDTLSRVVLSDWGDKGQYYLVRDNGDTEFVYFNISNGATTKIKSNIVKVKLLATLAKLYLTR